MWSGRADKHAEEYNKERSDSYFYDRYVERSYLGLPRPPSGSILMQVISAENSTDARIVSTAHMKRSELAQLVHTFQAFLVFLRNRDRLLRRPSMNAKGEECSDKVFPNELEGSIRLTPDVLWL